MKILIDWRKGLPHMPLAIPMIWTEPSDPVSDCYFCVTAIKGIYPKAEHTVQYPNLTSVIRPMPHNVNLPIDYIYIV